MDVWRRHKSGRIDKTLNISAENADRIYRDLKWGVRVFGNDYIRIQVIDPMRGGHVVCDTDWDVFGRPGMIGIHAKTPVGTIVYNGHIKPYMESDGVCQGFGTQGE